MKRALAGALALALGLAPAAAQVVAYPTTILSSTIVTGGTFQAIAGLGVLGRGAQSRRSVTIQNNNLTDDCWLYIGVLGSASEAKAIYLAHAGGSYQRYYPYVPADAFNITCTSTSDTFYADTQ